jgi:hypothetical protein
MPQSSPKTNSCRAKRPHTILRGIIAVRAAHRGLYVQPPDTHDIEDPACLSFIARLDDPCHALRGPQELVIALERNNDLIPAPELGDEFAHRIHRLVAITAGNVDNLARHDH